MADATPVLGRAWDNGNNEDGADCSVHEGARGLRGLHRGTARCEYPGETLDKARENLNEAVALVLEANRALAEQSLEDATVIRETFVLPAA